MRKPSKQGDSIRTTITMPATLWKNCKQAMKLNGYGNNFSAFLSEAAREQNKRLIRQAERMNQKAGFNKDGKDNS